MTTTTRPIFYRPIERHWYRLADFVQHVWHRFAATRTGRFAIWFATRTGRFLGWLLPRLLRIALRLVIFLAGTIIIVGGLTLFIFLSMAMGNGKLGKAISKANK